MTSISFSLFKKLFAVILLLLLFLSPRSDYTVDAQTSDPPPIDTTNWSNVVFIDSDVRSWAQTANLSVSVSGESIRLDYDKTNVWPEINVPGVGPGIVGSPWIFVYIDGQWHTDAWEYLGRGRIDKDTSNLAGRNPPTLCGVLDGALRNYRLQQNELYGFMVTGVPPHNNNGITTTAERSNIVMVRWNGTVNAQCSTTPPPAPQPNPPAPSLCLDFSASNYGQPLPCTYPPPIVCNPLPEDVELILRCNEQDINNYPGRTYEPGTNPADPESFGFNGIGGMAVGYSPVSDKLFLAITHVDGDRRELNGVMAHPQTMEQQGSSFRIVGGVVGTPMIAYDTDQDRFLVAWEDSRPCIGCRSIYGRFISGSGTPTGPDFAIQQGDYFFSDVEYDSRNQRFVVTYENGGTIFLKTVAGDGTTSNATRLPNYFPYMGQQGVTVNTNTNEYWLAYATVYTLVGADTDQEDDRIFFSRVSAETMQVVGEPVQLSQTRLGRLNVQNAHIAYSPVQGAAMAIWLERSREGVAGTWGRTIYDDGSLSPEYRVITPGTVISSYGFDSNRIDYNPWTDSFFVSSQDWTGNAWITEIDSGGLVYGNEIAVSLQGPLGNFNVTSTATPYGAPTLSSRDYAATVGTSYRSVNAPGPVRPASTLIPRTPQEADITTLPRLINQIYIWSLGVSVLLALLMMVLGGYFLMTAAGNAEQATKGKEYITSALIGVVIIFTAYLVLQQINPDLVNFNLESIRRLQN